MGFGQSVYQNLVKKDGFWTKCVLEFGKKRWVLDSVEEIGKKKIGFERSAY